MNNQGEKFHLPDSGFNKIIGDTSINTESGKDKKLVAYKESLDFARDLLDRYQDEIKANQNKDVDGWGEPYSDFQQSIRHFLEEIPDDIRKHFQGHGITRNSGIDQLASALNILANKSIKGYSGPLGGETYGYGARKNGDFLVISKLDKGLPIEQEKNSSQSPTFNDVGWAADIGAFVINVKYYPIIEELKKTFPDVNIIKANELVEYLKVG